MKKQAGFTLIELLVAIAVLSIMTGVLLRTFTVSSRISVKSREDERVLNLAKDSVETFKGYAFEGLDKELSEGEDHTKEITIGENKWQAVQGGGKFVFTRSEKEGTSSYLIEVEADYGKYSNEDAADGSVMDSNLYEMPRITDISSIQNAVVSPADLSVTSQEDKEGEEGEELDKDQFLTRLLLAKVNPPEDDGEGGAEEGAGSGSSGSGGSEETIYSEDDVKRILNIMIDSKSGGTKMGVSVQLIYTVSEEMPDKASGYPAAMSVKTGVFSTVKTLVEKKDKKEGKKEIENGIYVFLPENVEYDRIFVTAVKRSDQISYPVYIISPSENPPPYGFLDDLLKLPPSGTPDEIVTVFSNIPARSGSAGRGLVDKTAAYNRIYGLSVTVYKGVPDGAGLKKGEKLLNITSSKRE